MEARGGIRSRCALWVRKGSSEALLILEASENWVQLQSIAASGTPFAMLPQSCLGNGHVSLNFLGSYNKDVPRQLGALARGSCSSGNWLVRMSSYHGRNSRGVPVNDAESDQHPEP